jgi:hypothetical protein
MKAVLFAHIFRPILIGIVLSAVPARGESGDPFGISTAVRPETSMATTWRRLLLEIQADQLTVVQCRADPATCSPVALRFIAIVDEARSYEGEARVGHVNRAVNLAIAVAQMESGGRPSTRWHRQEIARVTRSPNMQRWVMPASRRRTAASLSSP